MSIAAGMQTFIKLACSQIGRYAAASTVVLHDWSAVMQYYRSPSVQPRATSHSIRP